MRPVPAGACASQAGFPGAADTIESFAKLAVESGARRLVLLRWDGRTGEFFAQNFSEDFLAGAVRDGMITFPADHVAEPFSWVVKTDASGYRRFYASDGQDVGRYPATPSNPRQRLRDIVKAVRRHGLDWPAPGKKEQRSQRKQEGH